MASSSRNQKVKRDVAKGTIVSRIATNSLIPERYDALYYEILSGLDLQNLPAHKQVAATLFAACTCSLICLTDCRGLNSEADFQERLVQLADIDDLYSRWGKLFDKLNSNSGQTKEQPKDQDKDNKQESLGIELQKILSANIDNDSRNVTN